MHTGKCSFFNDCNSFSDYNLFNFVLVFIPSILREKSIVISVFLISKYNVYFKIPFPFICITPSSLRIHVAFFPHFPFATVLAADVCIFVKQTILNRNRNTSNVFFIKSSFLDTKGIKLFYPLFYHYYFSTLDASISNRYCVLFPILLPVAGAITNLKLPL